MKFSGIALVLNMTKNLLESLMERQARKIKHAVFETFYSLQLEHNLIKRKTSLHIQAMLSENKMLLQLFEKSSTNERFLFESETSKTCSHGNAKFPGFQNCKISTILQ